MRQWRSLIVPTHIFEFEQVSLCQSEHVLGNPFFSRPFYHFIIRVVMSLNPEISSFIVLDRIWFNLQRTKSKFTKTCVSQVIDRIYFCDDREMVKLRRKNLLPLIENSCRDHLHIKPD